MTRFGDFGMADSVGDQGTGDVDAVKDVADVVQDAGGDLGHAGLPGDLKQLPVQPFQFLGRLLALRDVPEDAQDQGLLAGHFEQGIG